MNPKTPMDVFCDALNVATNEALKSGVSAPLLVMVLEMTKVELATGHIQNQRMQMMQEHARQMAENAPKIVPTGN